LISCRL